MKMFKLFEIIENFPDFFSFLQDFRSTEMLKIKKNLDKNLKADDKVSKKLQNLSILRMPWLQAFEARCSETRFLKASDPGAVAVDLDERFLDGVRELWTRTFQSARDFLES